MQIVPNPLSGTVGPAGNLLIIRATRGVCVAIRRRNFVLARRTTEMRPAIAGCPRFQTGFVSRMNRGLRSEQGRR